AAALLVTTNRVAVEPAARLDCRRRRLAYQSSRRASAVGSELDAAGGCGWADGDRRIPTGRHSRDRATVRDTEGRLVATPADASSVDRRFPRSMDLRRSLEPGEGETRSPRASLGGAGRPRRRGDTGRHALDAAHHERE